MIDVLTAYGNEPLGDDGVSQSTLRFLCFTVGGEDFGLSLLGVTDVLKLPDFTHVPFAPLFVRGVINLRGKVITVVDLRIKMGSKNVAITSETSVIVCALDRVRIGFVVDKVHAVIKVKDTELLQYSTHTNHAEPVVGAVNIEAIVRRHSSTVMILDLNDLMTIDLGTQLSDNKVNRTKRFVNTK